MSCAKAKRAHPAPAQDLYVSPLFQKSAALARRTCGRWYILSAKHGLLAPDTLIEPYDVTLEDYSRKERREWASRVHRQLMDARLAGAGSHLLWLAGRAYLADRVRLLPDCEHLDPLQGLGLGRRLSWLNARLAATGSDPGGSAS